MKEQIIIKIINYNNSINNPQKIKKIIFNKKINKVFINKCIIKD